MRRFPGITAVFVLAAAFLLTTAGCHKNQDQTAANNAGDQNPSTDPAAANLAPATYTTTQTPNSSASAPAQDSGQQGAPAQDMGGQDYSQNSGDPGYGAPPAETAPQPPPALPDYQQPPAPGDDYLWTPGYWGYAQAGYYWVPGAWVQAPYEGALWTPGYWGFSRGHYGFYPGYWGRHIGFYGGINYGFGYIGFGYQGGYWNGGHFNYNRTVNNVDVRVVHNVYNYRVNNNTTNMTRVSFNGGSGGVQVRARPQELVALREQHAAPMSTQIQHEQAARADRAQFFSANQGHPASLAVAHPVAADRNVRAPEAMPARTQPVPQERQVRPEQRPATPQQRQMAPPPQRQATPHEQRPVAAPEQRRAAPTERQAAPPPRQARPPQERQAPPQRKNAPKPEEEHPRR